MSAAPVAETPPRRLRWWWEAVYILVFYGIYTTIRNTQGSATVSARHAFENALEVIDVERAVGLFHEETLQDWFLDERLFMQFWNVFYGTAHFIVTIGALVWLFRAAPHRYPLWRNTLAFTTALALIGFVAYPLMPPRLLPPTYGFIDTLKEIGGLWSFDSGTMQKISNQYAAMPSLHFAWSSWCAFVLWPMVRRPWVKALVVAYPFATLFGVMVTANHYWLDALGGAVVLGAGYLLAGPLTRRRWSPADVPSPAARR